MDPKGKKCMVTGANSGIGKMTCLKLAERGAVVIMVCRDRKKCESAREEIIRKTGNEDIHIIICDLSLMKSVKGAVEEYRDRFDELHVLINNAGTILPSREITDEGNEKVFATNYLGHFMLTNLLLDTLPKSAFSRIINVTSMMHKRGSLDFEDLQMKDTVYYSSWKAYGNSKLALLMITYRLSEKLKGTDITANAYHPGPVSSEFGSMSLSVKFFYTIFSFLMRDPKDAADDLIYLSTSHELENVSGEYFVKKKRKRSSAESYDKREQRNLWKRSLGLVDLG